MPKMFAGKQTKAEELAEAKALKSGKISTKQYIAGEKSERKPGAASRAAKMAKAIKSGRLSPEEYASQAQHATRKKGK